MTVMELRLTDKTAVITGASSGLGEHFAHVLAAAGAHVILRARRRASLEAVAHRVNAAGGAASTVTLDVTDADSIAALGDVIPNVDILVNNAGVAHSALALDQTETAWDTVMNTNLRGAFLIAQKGAAAMKAHGRGGSIINISSILGLRQAATLLPYAVSKAGVIQMTKVLALELARFKIRVNALAPGYFDTNINGDFLTSEPGLAMSRRRPMRRVGILNELDGPLLRFASDASSYMTGSVIAVDGGRLVNGL
jgi:NAD(P)-dependent dehydrogenase (short-subunit alcohol dehydrogenase family)